MNLPAHSIRRLRQLLNWSLEGLTISREEAKEGLRILAGPKKSEKQKTYQKALRAAAAEKRAGRREDTKEIRAAVMKRADGKCECGCGQPFVEQSWTGASELDHWGGGSGRKTQRQSVENTWALRRTCHWQRQHNHPNAAHWNHVFEMHCRKHGYRFYAHIEKAALSRRGTA